MRELNEHHSFTGMQKDLVCSKHPVNFLYDARNIRLTSRGDSTMLAITNEKGTRFATDAEGVYVGHACISKYLVLFTSSEGGSSDRIYKIDLTNMDKEELYKGRLNFSSEHPITTLPFFESERIQKVYWVDGINQPRLINIFGDISAGVDTQFDFVRELKLQEDVYINKLDSGGYFPSGVIQYAFTYVNKYAQESNIFYITPLYYVAYANRGAAPDESVPCSFNIRIYNPDLDFNIVRIYSIQRTSLDGTAITRRVTDLVYNVSKEKTWTTTTAPKVKVADGNEGGRDVVADGIIYKEDYPELYIEVKGNVITWGPNTQWVKITKRIVTRVTRYTIEASDFMYMTSFNPYYGELRFTDTGTNGEAIDPSELLYKGRNSFVFSSITQKDNTLFLGAPKIADATYIEDSFKDNIVRGTSISSSLVSYNTRGMINAGFMHGETYRLGIQLQYKNGAWSDPIYKDDYYEDKKPVMSSYVDSPSTLPGFKGELSAFITNQLIERGFRKVRAVCVLPQETDRSVLFQCIACPTVYQESGKRQSSWYFRHKGPLNAVSSDYRKLYIPMSNISNFSDFTHPQTGLIEVDCHLENEFRVDDSYQTFHSPDIYFGDTLNNEYLGVRVAQIGRALLDDTYWTYNVQTSSGTIHPNASGAVNESSHAYLGYGTGIGWYYDYIVDDQNSDGNMGAYTNWDRPVIFYTYLWNRSGSLNNDTQREAGKGVQSAVLKKKVFANRREYTTAYLSKTLKNLDKSWLGYASLSLYDSDQLSVVRTPDKTVYQGNVDTVLSPKEGMGKYCEDSKSYTFYYLSSSNPDNNDSHGLWQYKESDNRWHNVDDNLGDYNSGIIRNRNIVRMKYKSTPHLVGNCTNKWWWVTGDAKNSLPIIDIIREVKPTERYGGTSDYALQHNQWLPCGRPAILTKDKATEFEYKQGDAYFEYWECLKTYPFTPEDENQCVEIGCFRLESRINPFGRYDRNRKQSDCTMMTPVNFNLMNMVYSQKDNFFTYRIIDKDYYKNNNYPNQITWSEEKQAGNDVDNWTKITLVSTYDMDGTKGKINYMTTFKDQIFIFQDKAISNLLFNSRVQIPTSDGTPIEITNNYKVEGYRTLSDGVGCSNKDLVKQTPNSIYFIDSISNHLFTISDSLQDLSATHYMTSWFNDTSIDKLMYDNINHDLYVVNSNGALCFSELLGQFVSFYDYDRIKLIETYDNRVFTLRQGRTPDEQFLWYMFEGHYNSFFEYEYEVAPGITLNTGSHKSWYLTFISNGTDAQTVDLDKIFTNIDYRMDFTDNDSHSPNLTFDYMQVTDEYQNTGVVEVKRLKHQNLPNSFHHKEANTQKKFRIWRIQIPRALTWKTDRITGKRKEVQSNDRIRNPWCKITLGNYGKDNTKALLHDINVQYYI